jgi:hypothetical protein
MVFTDPCLSGKTLFLPPLSYSKIGVWELSIRSSLVMRSFSRHGVGNSLDPDC